MLENIFVFGAGGHAKVVLDILEKQGLYKTVCLFDDDISLRGTTFYGYHIAGDRTDLLADTDHARIRKCITAVGDNRNRLKLAEWMLSNSFQLITAVHPSAEVGRGVSLGSNTAVMAGTVINSDSVIGDGVIINTAASIDHDCIIHDGVHIAPGCRLCGNVTVGRGSFIGAGTIITPGITIGEHSIIGAGSVVVCDIPPNVTAKGVPCVPGDR